MSDVDEPKTEEEEPPACPVKRGTQARESKQYYREIRKELGLGARDPVPEKFIRRKTYKPVVFEEKEKEILANEDIPLLKKEVRDKKKAMVDSKSCAKPCIKTPTGETGERQKGTKAPEGAGKRAIQRPPKGEDLRATLTGNIHPNAHG